MGVFRGDQLVAFFRYIFITSGWINLQLAFFRKIYRTSRLINLACFGYTLKDVRVDQLADKLYIMLSIIYYFPIFFNVLRTNR